MRVYEEWDEEGDRDGSASEKKDERIEKGESWELDDPEPMVMVMDLEKKLEKYSH